jgi:hypothetical protein
MPPTVFTDQSGATPGTALDASHLNGLVSADLTEAATNDTLGGSSTFWNNLNRLRYQLGIVVGNAGASWNAAVQMLPLSQKGAASGVPALDANKVLLLPGHVRSQDAGTGGAWQLVAGSNDTRGLIQITVGTGGTTAGAVLGTITFGAAFPTAPYVILGPHASTSYFFSTAGFAAYNETTTSWQIYTAQSVPAQSYTIAYWVVA